MNKKTSDIVGIVSLMWVLIGSNTGISFLSGKAFGENRAVLFWMLVVLSAFITFLLFRMVMVQTIHVINNHGWAWKAAKTLDDGEVVQVENCCVLEGISKDGNATWVAVSRFPYDYDSSLVISLSPQQIKDKLVAGHKYQWTGTDLKSVTK
ncbi:MAG TPA: hypothetical protein VFQ72_02540 [Candidatus Paceibacterota bacterium]|nr:hypothetical protein [Candidatus Paceibacterota bacterium]